MVLHGATPHAPIYNLLMGDVLPAATPCEMAALCKQRILEAICKCAGEEEKPVQFGDEKWDRASYLKALRELYDWLTHACASSEPAAMVMTTRDSCRSCG